MRTPFRLGLGLALVSLAGCPEGQKMEQWTPERDPALTASPSSAAARREAEKQEDEGLSAALASAESKKRDGDAPLAGSAGVDRGEGIAVGTPGPLVDAPHVRIERPKVKGGLPPEIVQRVARRRIPELRNCWKDADDRYLGGKIEASFVVDAKGAVDTTKLTVSSSGDAAPLVPCATEAFAKLQFPEPENGVVTVKLPITFTPGDLDGTIHGHPLSDVTLDDVLQALKDAGYDKVETKPRGDTGVEEIEATRGDEHVSLVFVPFEEKRARLTEEEWVALEAEGLVHHFRGFALAVRGHDRVVAKTLLVALIKAPPPAPPAPTHH